MKRTWRHEADHINGKVQSARFWYLTVLVAEQAAGPLAVALCLRLVQIILGVNVEPSAMVLWAGALAVALSLGWVVFGVTRRVRTPYEIAQLLDAGAHLHDSFSTAWFLLANPGFASGLEVDAHIAHATTRVSEIRLCKLFPLPQKRLSVVAFLIGVLAMIGAVRPRARIVLKNSIEPAAALRIISSSNSSQNPQKQEDRERPSGASPGDESSHKMAGPQLAQSGQTNARTQSPGMDAGDDHPRLPDKPGVEESWNKGDPKGLTSQAPAGDRNTVAKDPAAAPGESPNVVPKDSHENRTADSGTSKASLVSQLLSPMKNLLDMAVQRSRAMEADMQSAKRAAPAAGGNPASDRVQPSPQGPASNQPALPPKYSSADLSAQQAPNKAAGSLPPNIGGTLPKGVPNLPDAYPLSGNVIDLVDANPRGDTGHTRILAVQNTRSSQDAYSSDSDHHADSGQQMAEDDVPLACQRSIRAYLEHTREQQR
jgi:hypothetical protein